MSQEEILGRLNELLEAERAGVEAAAGLGSAGLKSTPISAPREQLWTSSRIFTEISVPERFLTSASMGKLSFVEKNKPRQEN